MKLRKPGKGFRANKQTEKHAGLKRAGIGKSFVMLALLAIPLMAIPPLLVSWLAEKQTRSSFERQLDLSIDIYANGVQRWVNDQISKIDVMANNPEVIQLFTAADDEALERKGLALKSYFPDALKVRLLRPGLQMENLDVSPPITFAAIELIQLAESSSTPAPMELHGAGSSQQHINLVRVVRAGINTEPLGILMVSLSASKLKQFITGVNVPGYTELDQEVGGASMLVSKQGDSLQKIENSLRQEAIEGSRWVVRYWPDSSMTGQAKGLIAGLLAVAVGALLLLLSGFGLRSRICKVLKQDHQTLQTLLEDMQGLRIKSSYPTGLVEMAEVMDGVTETAHALIATAPTKSGAQIATLTESYDEMAVVDLDEADPLFGATGRVDVADENNKPEVASGDSAIAESIFRAYDIRGIYASTLTEETAFLIGRAIGSEAYLRGEQAIVVGRDGRLSGESLMKALIEGLIASGRDVKDIGQVPTPVLYYAASTQANGSGVMVTGSHNPADYNGFKIMLAGETLAGDAIRALYQRIVTNDFLAGSGNCTTLDIMADYIGRITSDVQVPGTLKVVVDCGNGVAGAVAPQLFRALGCEPIELFCDVDGSFPNHHPDPSNPENLAALIIAVKKQGADLGIAFDGDGDRLGVVTGDGVIIWPDRLMMLFAKDVLLRNPGAQIIYDVKSTRNLATVIATSGGEPLMWQSGHSFIKAKMKQTGALLAGEMSGHIFFKERWYGFDDGLYAAARLLEILASDARPVSELFAELPDSINTPELSIPMAEGEPLTFMNQFSDKAVFNNASIAKLDGLRVETERGWGLVRASNTTPSLTLRFEAEDELALHSIQEEFRREMLQVKPDLVLPF